VPLPLDLWSVRPYRLYHCLSPRVDIRVVREIWVDNLNTLNTVKFEISKLLPDLPEKKGNPNFRIPKILGSTSCFPKIPIRQQVENEIK